VGQVQIPELGEPVRPTSPLPVARSLVLLALLFSGIGFGQESSLIAQGPQLSVSRPAVDGPALVFGRYLASIQKPDPFTGPGSIGVEIDASLPGVAQQGKMQAVREIGSSERSEYRVVRLEGDSTVRQQVIARYLDAEEQAEALPHATVAVTPANYKFRYVGSVRSNEAVAYIFDISPRKKRTGLIEGQIWIDSATGIAVRQAGRFVKRPSVFIRRIVVTRETNLRDGIPSIRVTHLAVETRLVGRAELTITERPLQTADRDATQ
jgi:hypothetical protein